MDFIAHICLFQIYLNPCRMLSSYLKNRLAIGMIRSIKFSSILFLKEFLKTGGWHMIYRTTATATTSTAVKKDTQLPKIPPE